MKFIKIIVILISLISILFFVSCSSKIKIINSEIKIEYLNQSIGLSPAKILIKKLEKQNKINYTINNYTNENIKIEIKEIKPYKLSKGYNYCSKDDNITTITSEKIIEIEGGQSYETQILIGCPNNKYFTTPIEIWISCKIIDTNYSINLISKILINEVKLNEEKTY